MNLAWFFLLYETKASNCFETGSSVHRPVALRCVCGVASVINLIDKQFIFPKNIDTLSGR